MQPEKPVLYAALICERVILDEEGSPILFRLVDSADVSVEGPSAAPVEVSCVLFTKWGGPAGRHTEKITLVGQDGQERELGLVATFELKGGSSSAHIRHFLDLQAPPAGNLIFRVYLDDQLYIDVPFQINVEPGEQGG